MSNTDTKDYGADDTMAKYEDGKLIVEHVKNNDHKGHSLDQEAKRNLSVITDGGRKFSTGGPRRLSQWDAMKIAKEGGVEVDEEIELLEEELAQNPFKSSWFKPVIQFKDPNKFV